MATLLSIQAGMPRELPAPQLRAEVIENAELQQQPTWYSGVYKAAIHGPVQITAAGIPGDGQANLKNHGGPDKAALMYSAELYEHWRKVLKRPDLQYGMFAENLTVSGLHDDTVCMGDVYRIGAAGVGPLVEVTQARQPCWKIARRSEQQDLVAHMVKTGWAGWYVRVLEPGVMQAQDAIELVERRHADWPVSRAVRVVYEYKKRPEEACELAALPELSHFWKRDLAR